MSEARSSSSDSSAEGDVGFAGVAAVDCGGGGGACEEPEVFG